MQAPPKPLNEQARLTALREYQLLDTSPTEGFDGLVKLAAHLFDVPTALVSLVDDTRQWFKAKVGLDACETTRDISFCGHAILTPEVMVVEDALTDHRFFDNPLVTGEPHIRFYAGAPLVSRSGYLLGTFCVIDYKPRGFTEKQCELLQMLAKQVINQAELHVHSIDAKKYYEQVVRHSGIFEDEVAERTKHIARTREQVIQCLARAAEYRDDDTGLHVQRVSATVRLIAQQLGLPEEQCEAMAVASKLHDIGKIGIPDHVLLKPDRLTENEYGLMQGHAELGSDILSNLAENDQSLIAKQCEAGSGILKGGDYPLLQLAEEIARTHHEKFDGSGYPNGLAGKDIPLSGRVTAVADVFDALLSRRPYKEPMPLQKCLDIMDEGRGKHFDPDVLNAFFACLDKILDVHAEFQDPADTTDRLAEHAA